MNFKHEKQMLKFFVHISFVVKTVNKENQKVFLNFCGSEKVPGWGMDDKKVKESLKEYGKEALDDEQMEALRVPISVGSLCPDVDKKGDPCLVVDCIFNLDIAKQAKSIRNLKIFLIDIVFEWVEQKVCSLFCRHVQFS